MPRPLPRAAALVAVLALAAPAAAQPGDPLELARGLRENGLPDLALEYLDQLAAKNPSPTLAAVLPLERAAARLDLAAEEADDAKRDALIARAKAEFEQFLAANANHPRRAEAAVALARVESARAKSAVSRANKIAEDAPRTAALQKARPLFEDAARRFGQAAAAYAKRLDDPDLAPAQKKQLTRDVYQAELDRAVNAFMLSRTYEPAESAADRTARGQAVTQAKDLFRQLAARDENHPLCWVARAWAGECDRENENPVEAQKAFDAVRDAAKRNPAAAQGARLARFFEVRAEFLAARDPAAFRKAQAALEQWLADPAYRTARPTPEVHAARWYLAYAREQQALALCDLKTKPPRVPPAAQALLRQAAQDFRRVAETANDYAERAAERRTQVIRLLIGDGDKDPAKITSFDEAVMAAQVQLYKAVKEAEKPEDRTKQMQKAAALYERARALPVPKDSAREALDAEVNLVFAYLASDRPYDAAVLGEHLARTVRAAGPAARAGLYAVQAYLRASAKLDPADAAGRQVDREHAAKLAHFLDKQFPADPSTDAARAQLGQLLLRDGKPLEAFDILARVNPGNPHAAAARLLEGGAALTLLTSTGTDEDGQPALTPQQKADVFRRAVADLGRVGDLPADAPAEDARLNVLVALQLAELHLTDRPAGYPRAEQAAAAAAKKAAAFTELSAESRQELALRAEHARLRAVFGQAAGLYQAGKYAEAVAKVAPALAAAAKDGPTAKDGQPEAVAAAAKKLDEFRRDSLLVLALQARIKEGAVDKVGELFDLMKRLGGSLDAGITAVGQLVAAARPQAEALRKEGKAAEADRLVQGVGVVLDKVAAEPNLSPKVLLYLGTALTDMGQADRAAEVLAKVPAPPAADLARRPADLDEKARPAVQLYRQARLETARAYRVAGRFDDADKALKEAMGTKEKPGWAAGAPDFRREAAYLLEDRAASIPDPKQAAPVWAEANRKWAELANDYLPTLQKLAAGRRDAKSAALVLADRGELPDSPLLPRKPEEVKGGLRDPKPPKWVTELLTETANGPDGKPRPNPVAQEYVRTLKNTVARVEAQIKPRYHDVFFESTRCLTRANAQLFKDDPAERQRKMARLAQLVRDLEAKNPDLSPEVRAKFERLMADYPQLKQEYDKLGKPEPAGGGEEPPPPAKNGGGSPAPAAAKPAAAPPRDAGNGGLGLVVGAAAGLLALGGVVAYVVLFRRPPPPPRRSAPAPLFDE